MRFAALDDENSLTRPVSKRDERGGEGGGGQGRDWQGGEAWRLDSGRGESAKWASKPSAEGAWQRESTVFTSCKWSGRMVSEMSGPEIIEVGWKSFTHVSSMTYE